MKHLLAFVAALAALTGISPLSANAARPQIIMTPSLPSHVELASVPSKLPRTALSKVGPLHAPGVDPIGMLLKRLHL